MEGKGRLGDGLSFLVEKYSSNIVFEVRREMVDIVFFAAMYEFSAAKKLSVLWQEWEEA